MIQNKLMPLSMGAIALIALAGCSSAAAPVASPETSSENSISLPDGVLEDGVLTVAVSTAPPYTQKDDSGAWSGIDIDLVNAIAKKIGVDVEYVDSKYDALMPGIEAGRFDATTNIGDFVERQETVTFVDYARSQLTVEVVADADYQPSTLLDLCDAVIGFEQGTAGGTTASEYLTTACPEAGKEYVGWQGFPDRTQLELALRSGRIEGLAAPIAGNDLSAAASDGEFENLVIDELAELPGTQAIYGLVVAKDSPLADVFLEALLQLVDAGVYQDTFDEWGIPNGTIPESQIRINGSTLTRT